MSGEEGSIDLAYNAQIMRTGRFVFPDDSAVNWQGELMRARYWLAKQEGGEAEWPRGEVNMQERSKTGRRHR